MGGGVHRKKKVKKAPAVGEAVMEKKVENHFPVSEWQ